MTSQLFRRLKSKNIYVERAWMFVGMRAHAR